jgi:hypothetical protein
MSEQNAGGVASKAQASGEAARPPLPPFTRETAIQKVRLAEDAWNSRDAEKVALAYTVDSRWRNRAEFVNGRREIIAFLKRKWTKELDYRLIKELWAFEGNRIAVRFASFCVHQRFADQGSGAEISVAAGTKAGRACGIERAGAVKLLSLVENCKGGIPAAKVAPIVAALCGG